MTRQSIHLRKNLSRRRWMRGSSPRMTSPTIDLTLSRLRGGAVDRRRGLAEQDRTLLWSADAAHIRVDRLRLLVGALDRRPRAHRFEPALEVREVGDVLALALVRHDPGIDRHVRDRVVAGDEGAIAEPLVQHAVEPVDLVAVAVDGVGNLVHRVVAEVIVLTGHRTEIAHLPEQPLDGVDARARIARE